MATRKPTAPTAPVSLSRSERRFWREAFVAYEIPTTLRHGTKITPNGLAHLAADFADAAVREEQRRFRS